MKRTIWKCMMLATDLTTHLITYEEISKGQECTPSKLSNFGVDKFVNGNNVIVLCFDILMSYTLFKSRIWLICGELPFIIWQYLLSNELVMPRDIL